MKLIIFLFAMVLASFTMQGQSAYQSYLAVKDTLTNADSHRDTIKVSGPKSALSFQVDILKISGTIAGTIKVYGSVNGTTYGSAAIDSVTLADASGNYQFWKPWLGKNPFSHYIIVSATTGTSSASTRASMMWRREN